MPFSLRLSIPPLYAYVSASLHSTTCRLPYSTAPKPFSEVRYTKIYLRLPEGNWQDPWNRERSLVRLRKTLYGLKQSARGWFEDVYDFLATQNLTASIAALGLFLGDGIIVLLYVDDIMVMATTIAKLTALCDALHCRFKAAPPKGATIPIGDYFQYVGLDIEIRNGCAVGKRRRLS
jgi:hypothetical protein